MGYETIDPRRAAELMNDAPAYAYLDVRSQPEFDEGHAPGAWNIPIAHMGPAGMTANSDFMRVVKATFASDVPLVVGCKMGGRSAKACEMLTAAGYSNVKNIDGGFGGRPNADEPSVQQGWRGCGLPVETEGPAERTYGHLESRSSG